ncbi:MAG: hypothetical protein ACJ72Z_02280 [Pyrinomonadaceae bacterium]
MLILLTILLSLAAVSAYFLFFKPRNADRELEFERVGFIPETTNLRPLFEPTAEELETERRDEELRLTEIEAEKIEAARHEKALDFQNKLDTWRASPNKKGFVELLDEAGEDGSWFADAAETAAQALQDGKIEKLSANDLAQMLESHFWLIPAEQRTPGVSYRFQTVLKSLRSASVTQ